jgi:glycosyltransferase involved in cell wall biosynthesis
MPHLRRDRSNDAIGIDREKMNDSRMPLVSAVTPCLNDDAYLQEMIESFLAQDYPYKELVVQDGGSTDGTHEILRRYPVRWNAAPDTGPHDAINKAILASRGEIIVIMPANDLFAPGAFTRAVSVLRARPEVAMAYGDCRIVEEHGALIRVDRPGILDIDRLLWTNFLLLQSAYIRREAFERVGLFDGVIKGPGDTDWLMRMVAGYPSESFLYIPEVWSSYRFGQSLKGVCFRDCEQNARVLLAAHERFLAAAENRQRLRRGEARACAGMHCQCACWLSEAGKRREAWGHLAQAFRQWPGLIFNVLGLKYATKFLLGRNLTRVVSKCTNMVRGRLQGC